MVFGRDRRAHTRVVCIHRRTTSRNSKEEAMRVASYPVLRSTDFSASTNRLYHRTRYTNVLFANLAPKILRLFLFVFSNKLLANLGSRNLGFYVVSLFVLFQEAFRRPCLENASLFLSPILTTAIACTIPEFSIFPIFSQNSFRCQDNSFPNFQTSENLPRPQIEVQRSMDLEIGKIGSKNEVNKTALTPEPP